MTLHFDQFQRDLPFASPQEADISARVYDYKACLESELVAALPSLEHRREQGVEGKPGLAQALFVAATGDRMDVLDVALAAAVFPRIGADEFLLLLPGFAVPDERHHARVLHPLHRDALGLVEGVEHVDRHPRMAADDLLLDAEDVHDREDAGALEIGLLFLLPVRKQARHARVLLHQRLDQIGMDHGVEAALREQAFDRLVVRELADLEAGRRLELDRLVEFRHPFDRLLRHAVFVLEDAAHPDDGGGLELLDADLLADQVGRLADALAGVDEHEAVTEAAMQEHRD